ncbi:MAG: hypothetical protein WAU86_19835 [Oricola sp.]
MNNFALVLAASAISLGALVPSAEAGQRVVTGAHGGSKVVTTNVDGNGASRSVNRTGPNGGTMTTTQDCVPGLSNCDRTMSATGAYGRTVSGSSTVSRVPGQSVTTGSVVGPNGGVYKRTVTRTW